MLGTVRAWQRCLLGRFIRLHSVGGDESTGRRGQTQDAFQDYALPPGGCPLHRPLGRRCERLFRHEDTWRQGAVRASGH